MSNKKISQFQVVTTLNGTTYVPVIQGSPLFDAIISASNFAASMQDYNDNYYIKVDGTNSDIDVLNFNQNPQAVNLTTAQFAWAAADGTFAYGVEDGGLIQLSKELFDYYVNVDTVPLVNGDVVSIVAISGNRKAIARTNVTNASSAKNVVGMVTVPTIAIGATGRVTKFGEVHDLVTNAYPDGTELFVSQASPGKWATTAPSPPNYTVKVGTVVVSQNGNGIVELGLHCYPKLTDLSDVNGVSSSINNPIVRRADGVIDAIDTGLYINGITASSGTLAVTGNLSATSIYANNEIGANYIGATSSIYTPEIYSDAFIKNGANATDFLLGQGGVKTWQALQEGIYRLYKPDGSAQVLSINSAGQVIINGDIVQNGSSYNTHAENINTPQAVITLRDGSNVGLGIGELAGFVIEKYDGVNNGILAIDKDGVMRVGDFGALQALLTREDVPVGYSFMYFNPTTLKAETLSRSITKTELADNDLFAISDSADSFKPKYATTATLKGAIEKDMMFYISDDTQGVVVGIGTDAIVSQSTTPYDSITISFNTL